jgi:hypothetical protein
MTIEWNKGLATFIKSRASGSLWACRALAYLTVSERDRVIMRIVKDDKRLTLSQDLKAVERSCATNVTGIRVE